MDTVPISSSVRNAFNEEGYVVLPGVLEAVTVEALSDAADHVFAQVVGTTLAEQMAHPRLTWWRLPDGQAYVFKVKPVADLAPAFGDVARGQALPAIASALLGAEVELMEDKVTYKEALDTDVPWAALPVLGEEVRKHSDATYFAARGFSRVLTVAVCLDDCPAEAGALRVWPGTHRRPVEYVPTADQGLVVPDESAPDDEAVTLAAEAGTVLAWDAALVHASDANLTGKPRRLLVLGYTAVGH
ncbi:phytanoyl-CoA dioxygenase family protein [Actinoplanes flavus]|uniref:Phytanoyl-CoA dioxygenase family protein n=1 Tax=Actinoplanes flavus TaxID=2820290 RepID=A0ABS3UST2_9ACTN|nr:phytanoyl-CoA dioxygenase family protein [Actinoplanes flavus]MBO3741634.1 phytanoyl-CoA dioxygenase family protein [Actinoplanes flavus]